MDPNDLVQALVAIVIGMAVVGMLLGSSFLFLTMDSTDDVELYSDGGQVEMPNGVTVKNASAQSGLGDAVRLSGADDSEVTTNESLGISPPLSVCSWAEADSAVVSGDESRVIAGSSGLVLYYDGGSDEYGAWWFNESNRNSYAATIAAPDPENYSLICGRYNGTDLSVSRNATISSPVSTAGNNYVDVPDANWDGTLEETRVFDSTLNGSQLQEFVGEPSLSINSTVPNLRFMYDTRNRDAGGGSSTVPAYFWGGDAKLTNGSYVDGFASPPIQRGVDFSFSNDFRRVELENGILNAGDVLYVDYDPAGDMTRFIVTIGVALLGLVLVLVPLLKATDKL